MTTQRELKLEAPPGFRLPELGEVFAGLDAVAKEVRTLHCSYYDTRDLRIIRWGGSLCHRSGEGWSVKLPGHADAPAARRQVLLRGARGRAPAKALDLLRAFVRNDPVQPVARLRTLRQSVEIRDADGKRLAEVIDDEISVLEKRRVSGRFRAVEVRLDPGAPTLLLGVLVERLQQAGAGGPDPTPEVARALGTRALMPEILAPGPDRSSTVGAVVRGALAASVARLLRHDPGVRLGEDPEDVHQARVATRRLRSDLRTFEPLLDAAWVNLVRKLLLDLGRALGRVRDPEVLLERLRTRTTFLPAADRPVVEGLLGRLELRRRRARGRLLDRIRDPGYADLLELLVAAAQSPPLLPGAQAPARTALPPLLEARWRSLSEAIAELPPEPQDEELHQVRIRAKQCRYAAEALEPVFGKRARRLARSLGRVQDALGEYQDAAVARRWLREAGQRSPRATAFVAGGLSGLEEIAGAMAKESWGKAWRRASQEKHHAWFTGTGRASD